MTDDLNGTQPPSLLPDDAARERRIWWTLVAIGAAIMIGIMVLIWPLIRGRLDAAKNLDTATVIISQSATDLDLIARTVQTDPSAETSSVIADVQRKIPAVREEAARGVALVNAGFDRLTDDEQRRATLTREALVARVAMLDAAAPIVSAEGSASVAAPVAVDAWNLAVRASLTEKAAVSAYDLKTPAGLNQASALASQAMELFAEAQTKFAHAASAYPAAGLDVYSAYAKARIEQLMMLNRAIGARRSGNVTQANAIVVTYNAAQERNAAIAKALPPTPAQAIADAFKVEVAAKMAAFEKAKSEADAADAALKSL